MKVIRKKAKISSIALHDLQHAQIMDSSHKKYTKWLSNLWYHPNKRRLGSSVVGPMRKCTDEFEGWVGVVPTPTPAAWLPISLVRHCKALPWVSPAGLNQLMHPKFLLGHLGHLQWPPQPCLSCQAYLVISKLRSLAPDLLARSVWLHFVQPCHQKVRKMLIFIMSSRSGSTKIRKLSLFKQFTIEFCHF